MRAEKKYLIEEVSKHLQKSDYVFLTNFDKITVADVATLRSRLKPEKAEFHVVKNSSLRVAAKELELPDLDSMLTGPTAIIVGGRNPAGVAKIVRKFFDETKKLEGKGGVLSKKALKASELDVLATLPTLDVLRAQFLALLMTPATSAVRVLNAIPQSLVNVLQAKVRAGTN
ncbi:MAG TPA: 50S ribosomal protein L10 [Opitutaceae bacterium]